MMCEHRTQYTMDDRSQQATLSSVISSEAFPRWLRRSIPNKIGRIPLIESGISRTVKSMSSEKIP